MNVWVVHRPSQSCPYMLALLGAMGPVDRMAVPPGFEQEDEGIGEDANVNLGVERGLRYCWHWVTTPHCVVSTLCSWIANTSMLKSWLVWTNVGSFPPVELKLNPLILIPAILVCSVLFVLMCVPMASLSMSCSDDTDWVGDDGGVSRVWLLFRSVVKVEKTLVTVIPDDRNRRRSYLHRILTSRICPRRSLYQPNW